MGRVRMDMTRKPRRVRERRLVVRPTSDGRGRVMPARKCEQVPAFAVEDLVPGAVYRMDRDRGLTSLAIYTGESTATGRCRFEVVDPMLGESRRFSARAEAVLGLVAESLAEWCRRGERMVGKVDEGVGE